MNWNRKPVKTNFRCPQCSGTFATIRYFELGVDQSTPVSLDRDGRIVQNRGERTIYLKRETYYECPSCQHKGSLRDFGGVQW